MLDRRCILTDSAVYFFFFFKEINNNTNGKLVLKEKSTVDIKIIKSNNNNY